jgi:adenine-specific DNA-methyltransferase
MPTLNFKGKSFVQNHHLAVKYHQLVPRKDKSLTEKISLHDNLIIQGDNLKALKALLPTYAGKIKCIYIDPPYNTGNEGWRYNDNVNSPMIREWFGKEIIVDDLIRHDKWLCMMLPRLKLLKELLSEDGVIFISIDDIEHQNLRVLLDEIFNEENFLSTFIWKSRQNVDSRNQSKVSIDHEYIIAYSKNKDFSLKGKESDKNKYSNPDNDPRGPWMSNSILGLANKQQRPNLHYPIIDPQTGNEFQCPPNTGWRYSKQTMQEKIQEGRIVFPNKEDGRPREKKFINELADIYTGFSSILPTDIVGFTLNGTRDLREILPDESFNFPKPYNLVKALIHQINDDDFIILDSFAGSGTTAHAALDLNKEDGGNRRFILVEMESYADCLTAERVRRVINGVPESKNFKEGTGGTFSYFELGEPIEMESILRGENLPSYEEFAKYLFYTATGEEFDPTKIDEETNYIGTSREYEIYLFYKPDLTYLKSTALTLDRAKALGKHNGKKRLVFAPAKFVDSHTLTDLRIEFCQLPFEIYKLKG